MVRFSWPRAGYPLTMTPATTRSAKLPSPRGAVSAALIAALRSGGPCAIDQQAIDECDPWGDDLQIALFVCQELTYRGWAGVPDDREFDPGVVGVRVQLENRFLAAIDAACAASDPSVEVEFRALVRAPSGGGAADHLARVGTAREFADYFSVRSLYHLKEADPHAWVIPRLPPAAKAPFVAVLGDEYGGGRPERVHQALFADLLEEFGLDRGYLAYLDAAPAVTLAPVTLMTALGHRRARRGACVGHFAATEITSSPGSAQILAGLERLDASDRVRHFYREHVEADAVHEQVMRDEVVAGLLQAEPDLEADVVTGVRAFLLVEDRLSAAFMRAWESGSTVSQT